MTTYNKAMEYKNNYPGNVAWRIKKHASVIERHLNPNEEVLYAFVGQKNHKFNELFNSCVVAVTSKRMLIGQKRVVWGYFLTSVTPDLYNDLKVYQGLFWGRIIIDTVKEKIIISNLSKKGLDDVETNISEYMMKAKRLYKPREEQNE